MNLKSLSRIALAIVSLLSASVRAEEPAKGKTVRLLTVGHSFPQTATHEGTADLFGVTAKGTKARKEMTSERAIFATFVLFAVKNPLFKVLCFCADD